jgi:hypothetical protein
LAANPAADVSALSRVHYGTAPTPTSMVHEALQRLGPILRQQYGMTEAVQPLCVLYPNDHLQDGQPSTRIASCGRPVMDVGHHGARRRRPASCRPAKSARSPSRIAGIGEVAFWRRPELERESIRDGWYYSGDLGRFDDEGFLYIVGRNKDMMISGGFNVYAREVEDALHTHPAVAEVAVLGLPDAQWGEVIAAFVVRRPGETSDADSLARHCAEQIAGYKKPRVIEFVDALPRNHASKVTKERSARRLAGAPSPRYPRSNFQMNTATTTTSRPQRAMGPRTWPSWPSAARSRRRWAARSRWPSTTRQGRLTARERIAHLLDEGSFKEIGVLAGAVKYGPDRKRQDFTPSNAVVGVGKIAERRTVVAADDFTIRGGSSEASVSEKWIYADRYAWEYNCRSCA